MVGWQKVMEEPEASNSESGESVTERPVIRTLARTVIYLADQMNSISRTLFLSQLFSRFSTCAEAVAPAAVNINTLKSRAS